MANVQARALSLTQPWASAIGIQKFVETRSWSTKYRGALFIHATKENCGDPSLPRGCVVAVCQLWDCVPAEKLKPTPLEQEWGNFAPGRFGWLLSDIVRLRLPVKCRGFQGLWVPTVETCDAVSVQYSMDKKVSP